MPRAKKKTWSFKKCKAASLKKCKIVSQVYVTPFLERLEAILLFYTPLWLRPIDLRDRLILLLASLVLLSGIVNNFGRILRSPNLHWELLCCCGQLLAILGKACIYLSDKSVEFSSAYFQRVAVCWTVH